MIYSLGIQKAAFFKLLEMNSHGGLIVTCLPSVGGGGSKLRPGQTKN